MRHLDLDWTVFFNALPAYKELSVPARETLIVKGSQNQPLIDGLNDRPALLELVEKGMYVTTPGGRHVALAAQYHAFVKALRAMHRSRIDDMPGADTFDRYLADNFTRDEWSGFHGPGAYWAHAREGLYMRVASLAWIEDFLKTDPAKWESQHSLTRDPAHVSTKEESALLKKLVKHSMSLPAAAPFEELYALSSDRELLARSIFLGIRGALVYPMLRRDTLEPVLGLWPKITTRLHRPASVAPVPVTPAHVFCAPLLMDAMTAVLTACIAEPLRLLAGGGWNNLYAKAEKQVAARLMDVPEWLTRLVRIEDARRVASAVDVLHQLQMVADTAEDGRDRRLEVTQAGRAWLAMPAKARLKALLDRVRDFKKRERDWHSHWDELTRDVQVMGHPVDASQAVREAFARLAHGKTVRLHDFTAYEASAHNPLAVQRPSTSHVLGHPFYRDQTRDEDHDQQWTRILMEVLAYKLLGLGAIEIGVMDNGDFTISLSDAGRYVFELAEDFSLLGAEVHGAIVVQPNFEIVFMAPSPYAEAELSSFTERQGKSVGALLKITKQSVWAAAAAGVTVERVVESLRTHSSVHVPSNVEREIRGWMAQCRSVSLRAAVLIHCPDAETASRVLATDRSRLVQITDTVLELNDPDYRLKLVKRLREIGVFI
jgi:hypothetical protein